MTTPTPEAAAEMADVATPARRRGRWPRWRPPGGRPRLPRPGPAGADRRRPTGRSGPGMTSLGRSRMRPPPPQQRAARPPRHRAGRSRTGVARPGPGAQEWRSAIGGQGAGDGHRDNDGRSRREVPTDDRTAELGRCLGHACSQPVEVGARAAPPTDRARIRAWRPLPRCRTRRPLSAFQPASSRSPQLRGRNGPPRPPGRWTRAVARRPRWR